MAAFRSCSCAAEADRSYASLPALGERGDEPKRMRAVSFTIGGNEEDYNGMGERATQRPSRWGCELGSGAGGNAIAAWPWRSPQARTSPREPLELGSIFLPCVKPSSPGVKGELDPETCEQTLKSKC